jgi:hypothetical protein
MRIEPDQIHFEITARQGKTATGGTWTRPATLDTKVLDAIGRALTALRLDDRQPTQLTPRCHIAAETSANAGQDVWPLRTLVFLLVGRIETSEQRILLGRAARAVLQVAIEQELPSQLTAAAIGFVADTYASERMARLAEGAERCRRSGCR